MVENKTPAERVFDFLIYSIMIILGVSCILPMVNILAISFSSRSRAMANFVSFWPQDFTALAYKFIIDKPQFMRGLGISALRILLGVPANMLLILITAYPLSKRNDRFKGRQIYVWFLFVTMVFSGGLIPTYLTVRSVGLVDTIWALILPGAVGTWNIILMLNFFRALPISLEEAAFVDGAGHLRVLTSIYIPLSAPAMATIGLFVCVGHWNAWFDGLIYMNNPVRYPLQTYIYTIVTAVNAIEIYMNDPELMLYAEKISDKTVKAAQIFLAALPILVLYPFLQKYFMKGIVLGSVKE
jgi:putative aldouronate transport system permease protein